MSASVAEILPLKINLGAAGECCQPLCEVEGSGSADKCSEQAVKFRCKRRIFDRFVVGLLQLLKRCRERLGHIAAAEPAKAAEAVGHLRERNGSDRRRECHGYGRGMRARLGRNGSSGARLIVAYAATATILSW